MLNERRFAADANRPSGLDFGEIPSRVGEAMRHRRDLRMDECGSRGFWVDTIEVVDQYVKTVERIQVAEELRG